MRKQIYKRKRLVTRIHKGKRTEGLPNKFVKSPKLGLNNNYKTNIEKPNRTIILYEYTE